MKRYKIKYFLFAIAVMFTFSCKEEGTLQPLEKSTQAPDAVSNVRVDNQAGKALITYSLPPQKDLLYVKAVYSLAHGKEMEVKSSYYNNSLLVEGFADELEHEVKLYAVNRSEIESEPVSVLVKPEKAPIWDVFNSLNTVASFGGIQITAENATRADLAILVLEKNQYEEWEINPNSVYTSTDDIKYTLRGLDTLEQPFAFTIRDRWLNYTDTLFANIKPLYEAAIPKSSYRGMNLPGDAPNHPSTPMGGMWDGNIIDWPSIYMTQNAVSGPHVITFDIGNLAKLSRVIIWDYPEYFNDRTYYYLGNLKEFEIWGSDNPPVDGSFDNWNLLGTYNATKPSGLPFGQQNDEDYRFANSGQSWEIDIEAPKVRYLRIRSTKNWGGTSYMAIAEIQVYGDPR